MVEPNYAFRAITRRSLGAARRRAVVRASILGASKSSRRRRAACSSTPPSSFSRDAHGVARRLRDAQQGSYSLDRNRSAIYLPRTKAFPRNTEVEATLTFTDERSSRAARRGVTPTRQSSPCASIIRSSRCRSPAYTPRRSIRASASSRHRVLRLRLAVHRADREALRAIAPIAASRARQADRLLRRQRRAGADPQRARRRRVVVEPGVRSGRLPQRLPGEGAAADADPMDIRYNVINWVHRSTRGWSYGGSVVDPRTGEIIKGNVTLGSLRIRQDVHDRARPHAAVRRARRTSGAPSVRRDGAGAHPPALRARSRPHARPRSQHGRLDLQPRLGDGLSRAAT
jgi:hypothetical protein